MVLDLVDHLEHGFEKVLHQNYHNLVQNLENLKNIAKKRSVLPTLKEDLARYGCGVNVVEGALDCPREVLPNSEIKSGGCPIGFCGKRD